MVKELFALLTESPKDNSWVELDDDMRRQLKRAGVASLAIVHLVAIVAVLTLFRSTTIGTWLRSVLQVAVQTAQVQGELPKWLLTALTAYGTVLVGFSLVLYWALFDVAHLHYRLDALTFRAIASVNARILTSVMGCVHCTGIRDCSLKRATQSRTGQRRFINEVFYPFANADQVGQHNQKDMRKQVFRHWGLYYVVNYTYLVLILCVLWFGLSCLAVRLLSGWWNLVLLAPTAVLVTMWVVQGRIYRRTALELAEAQVRAFHQNASDQLVDKARLFAGTCGVAGCRL